MNRPISLLLVDDDYLVSTATSAWLEDEGFTVHTASSGEEALRLMASIPVVIALVDLNLGDMDGEAFIIRALACHPGTRFLILTGKLFYQLPAKLQEVGMQQHDVVFKPIAEMDAFSARIRHLATGVECVDAT